MITANKISPPDNQICQCDIFKDIQIIEDIQVADTQLHQKSIIFPYVICLNQECDLLTDSRNRLNVGTDIIKDSALLHLAVAPVFVFELFKEGKHWGNIFNAQPLGKKNLEKIEQNEISRYHYLKFAENAFPDMIIDFKHFFSINRNFLYKNISKRVYSFAPLYKEKISQRFSFYISRIGLPD